MHDCKKCEQPKCCGKNGGKCCHSHNVEKPNPTDNEEVGYNLIDMDHRRRNDYSYEETV
jgi:hypothetical protein